MNRPARASGLGERETPVLPNPVPDLHPLSVAVGSGNQSCFEMILTNPNAIDSVRPVYGPDKAESIRYTYRAA
jgi:hypothetical protein